MRRCHIDVACRVIVGEDIPDFRTISDFPKIHLARSRSLLGRTPRRTIATSRNHPGAATPVLTIGRGYVTKSGKTGARLVPFEAGRHGRALAIDGEPGLADDLILQFGYFGIFFVLVLGGLGLPVPEEAPIILAGILSRKGTMHWIPALASCFAGVLVGDFVVYFLGFFYGEKVLSLPLTRKFLTRAREAQIKGYFHRHGVKILILGRFAVGFRTAAYLTAGILRLPTLKLFLTDLFAASISTLLMFWLAYAFASQVEVGFREAKHYITPAIGLAISIWLLHRYIKARLRAGEPVGPPVLVSPDDAPLPPDDLHARSEEAFAKANADTRAPAGPAEESAAIDPASAPIAPELPPVVDPSLSHHPALESGRPP